MAPGYGETGLRPSCGAPRKGSSVSIRRLYAVIPPLYAVIPPLYAVIPPLYAVIPPLYAVIPA